MTPASSDEQKWTAVAGLVRTYEGQVRISDQAQWLLTSLQPGQGLTSSLLEDNVQFRGATSAFELGSLDFPPCYTPDWNRQTVRLAAPAGDATDTEWRLQGRICVIGQLLLQLGSEFSAADVQRYWESLNIVVEKRPRERGSRGKKRGRG